MKIDEFDCEMNNQIDSKRKQGEDISPLTEFNAIVCRCVKVNQEKRSSPFLFFQKETKAQ